jgi:hypothetical protein
MYGVAMMFGTKCQWFWHRDEPFLCIAASVADDAWLIELRQGSPSGEGPHGNLPLTISAGDPQIFAPANSQPLRNFTAPTFFPPSALSAACLRCALTAPLLFRILPAPLFSNHTVKMRGEVRRTHCCYTLEPRNTSKLAPAIASRCCPRAIGKRRPPGRLPPLPPGIL